MNDENAVANEPVHAGEHRTGPKALSNLSIDCVVLGLHAGRLKVLLVKYDCGPYQNYWALPGGWLHVAESVDESAARHLRDLTGLDHIYLEQLRAFGEVNRVPDGRIVTIAYYALVSSDEYELVAGNTAADVQWHDVKKSVALIFDHNEILAYALQRLRHKIRHEPIGFNLLPQKFTLLQLQEVYEAILDTKLYKPNFRRKLLKMKLLIRCGEKQQGVAHRAAELYRFDMDVYRHLCESGFAFEV